MAPDHMDVSLSMRTEWSHTEIIWIHLNRSATLNWDAIQIKTEKEIID